MTSLRSEGAVVDLLAEPRVVGSGRFECEFTVRAVTIDEARRCANDVWDRAMSAGLKGLTPDLPDSGWTASISDPEPVDWPSDSGASS